MFEEIEIDGGFIQIFWDKRNPLPTMIITKDDQEIEIDLNSVRKELYSALNFINLMAQ